MLALPKAIIAALVAIPEEAGDVRSGSKAVFAVLKGDLEGGDCTINVRFGSKPEKLNARKCFPLCP
jgi:hypothetical protein